MDFNKNGLQTYFNQIKGTITELNDAEKFCSVTLLVGHENTRYVNITVRKLEFDKIVSKHSIGDRVVCKFYPVSNKKTDRWYTHANLLSIDFDQV